jgi:hypothetical protein
VARCAAGGRAAAAVRVGDRGGAGRHAGQGVRAAGRGGAGHGAPRDGPARHPAHRPWSRKHADTQARLCARYLTPAIARLRCEDITVADLQAAVNTAPTPGEGDRLARTISALVHAGAGAGYLASPRLARVRWQPGPRPAPQPTVSVAGESPLWVDPGDIPAHPDVTSLATALGEISADYELMCYLAAYAGLRWGEIAALTTGQADPAARTITVDRKVIEIGGTLHVEPPKGRKQRRTIYPGWLPAATPSPPGSPPASSGPTPSAPPAPTRTAWSSPPPAAPGGGPPTSPAASWPPPTGPPAGAPPPPPAAGPGTACATSSAPPPCSPGTSTPPTSPAWPGTPTSASPWTCTSAPPPVPSTAPAPPPTNPPN